MGNNQKETSSGLDLDLNSKRMHLGHGSVGSSRGPDSDQDCWIWEEDDGLRSEIIRISEYIQRSKFETKSWLCLPALWKMLKG